MPLYICNAEKGAIDAVARTRIAADVTRIHCEVTGAPSTFVHVFFFEEAPHLALNGKAAFLFGNIRHGRTDAQKAEMTEAMRQSIHQHAGIALGGIATAMTDTPASWVMEGGDLLPEPGEEAEWLEVHQAKLAAAEPVRA